MINDRSRLRLLFVYREALRLWDKAGVLRRVVEGNKCPRGALDQPDDRLAQARVGRAAGQYGNAGKLRCEIGRNLHG